MPLHSASLHAAAFGADDGGCHPAEAAAAAQAGLLPAGHPAWPGLRASARRRAAAVALLDSGGPLHGGVPAVRPPRAQRLAAAFEKVAEAKVGDAHGKADGKGRSDDALVRSPVASNAKYISALAGPVTLVSSLLCVAAAWMEIKCGQFLNEQALQVKARIESDPPDDSESD
ncbi:unnamed protein product [Prorocentrum cordatum]|uniref:Uncharacterized protein n=1 Tax=Prorocentrum cordatum TaxID=2364126 RepID=A0ABN9XPV5_9DINO|nr:unnamed protein product [Polarella glacialis]